ncbi:hypothetical protein DPM19_33495 [Actinomadura craniellae]|uniref:Uncharacterized protein n=1 Tax=Actinomadura craniellae TaxID=2231787 RepID=A0A365GVM0_9ACTN|nr:hypothetical protein [Actinomadura craniellae]RAY10877.1 hypothetical protein DPM19_33495 [Actinomadura craniellae]
MRQVFAHDAVVLMRADDDLRAPGAAVTVALCGHWKHEPPCPLAAHHTAAERSGDEVRLRILFAAEPADETEVRDRIEAALSRGRLDGPDGATTRWRFRGAAPGPVGEDEGRHAERLAQA